MCFLVTIEDTMVQLLGASLSAYRWLNTIMRLSEVVIHNNINKSDTHIYPVPTSFLFLL